MDEKSLEKLDNELHVFKQRNMSNKSIHVFSIFPTSRELKMYTPATVLIHAGINDVLNNKSQSNTENLLSNIKYMVDKCRKFGVKNVLISGLVFTTKVSLEVMEKILEKIHTFCSSNGLIYIDSRNIRVVHLCQDNHHLPQSGKKILFNNFIPYLNSNSLMYSHPSQTWT